MDSSNKNEMEEIQRGLEAFLEKEMDGGTAQGKRRSGTAGGTRAAGGQEELHIIGQPEDEETYPRSGRSRYREEPYPEDWQDEEGEEPFLEEESQNWDAPVRRRRAAPGEGAERRRVYREDELSEDLEELPRGRQGYDRESARRRQQGYDREPVRRSRQEYDGEPVHRSRQEYEEEPVRRRRAEAGDQPGRRRAYREEEFTEDWEEAPRRKRPAQEAEPSPRERSREGKKSRGEGNSQRKGKSREAEQSYLEEDSRMSKKSQKAQKKRRKKKSRLKKFLIAVALIVVLLGVGMYQLVGVVYGKMTYREIDSVASAPLKEDGVVNILLIGNDSRENGEDGRSDAMILVSISNRTKTIYMTSLLRDMYVDIPGHDGNRLNAAYSYGGAELLMETIEQNFDIPVNRYMLVNFEAFANLVDAVDGIDLELSKGEIEYVNGYLWEYNMLTGRPDGTDNMDPSVADNGPVAVHLNGPQSLAYSRNRYIGTDFGRTERQRKVLTEVIHKLPSAMLTNAGGLIDGLMPNLTTNLTRNECFRLSLMAGKLLTYDIVSDSIPQPGTYSSVTIRKMDVLEVDFDANIRYLKEKIYGE